jgi:hypothetical protein
MNYGWLMKCINLKREVMNKNKLGKIILFFLLFSFPGYLTFAQSVTQQRDTLQVTVQQDQSDRDINEKSAQGNQNMQAAKAGKTNANKKVKQIKGARPDMSKARGARPPVIVRPGGSGIPKGIGKPKGVGKRGGR